MIAVGRAWRTVCGFGLCVMLGAGVGNAAAVTFGDTETQSAQSALGTDSGVPMCRASDGSDPGIADQRNCESKGHTWGTVDAAGIYEVAELVPVGLGVAIAVTVAFVGWRVVRKLLGQLRFRARRAAHGRREAARYYNAGGRDIEGNRWTVDGGMSSGRRNATWHRR